ncbi:MAG: FecR family protein [Woeseiaceae bacterium]|nr:FecR family protein [Woeseiaceae bacterium]
MRETDQAIEDLLGRAAPRPTPPAETAAKAKLAIEQEWQQVTRRRIVRRRMLLTASAATFVLAIALVMNTLLAPVEQPIRVATMDKAIGTVYMLGEKSELSPVVDLAAVRSGETIKTDRDAGVGLSWDTGGSLRLDENTEVRFVSTDRIELRSGRIYFDSMPETGIPATLTIDTREGEVTHVGTRYMAAVDSASLTVSVRDGKVRVDGYHKVTVDEGERMRLVGSSQPEMLDIRGYGPDWQWIELTAPVQAVGGSKLKDLLAWVARETGYRIEFNDGVEAAIGEVDVTGVDRDTPREALDKSLRITALDYRFDDENGVIIISHAGR